MHDRDDRGRVGAAGIQAPTGCTGLSNPPFCFEKLFFSPGRRLTWGTALGNDTISAVDFAATMARASDALKSREATLAELAKARNVLVYSFGACGKNLARQLRHAGINCVIFDNAKTAVAEAAAEGFETTATLDLDIPWLVAAGQNQLAILPTLPRPAYNLVEGLYAFDLVSSYGNARTFAHFLAERIDELYALYHGTEASCQNELLALLQFRASLDVRYLAARRTPVAQMWVPPEAVGGIESFCDVGAYDGDTLIQMKAAFPDLRSSFAVEPNADMVAKIEAVAARLGLDNRIFVGLAWNHATKLDVRTLPSGMMAVTESDTGAILADTLDHVTAPDSYEYVKFDVEGAEQAALQGGRNLLRNARCIAVACYHFSGDIIDIPQQLESVLGESSNAAWRRGFHHYSECFEDSIFYYYRSCGD